MDGAISVIIKRTSIHQIQIFKNDEVPFWRLCQPSPIEALRSIFNFNEMEVGLSSPPARPALTAQMGSFVEGSLRAPIMRLVVEDRRVLLDIEGNSDDAEKVLSRLRTFLIELSENQDPEFLTPIISTQESEVIARLEIDPDDLIAPFLRKFMQSQATTDVQYSFAKGTIALAQVVFDVNYREEGTVLDDRRVTLSRKQFLIGPREGFRPEERMYYSKAPISTQAHLRLLKGLEGQLAELS